MCIRDSFTAALLNKLNGIAAGAEVNVQADWSSTDSASDAFIKNKPSSFPPSSHTHTKAPVSYTHLTWQQYFDELKPNEKWLAQYGQTTEGQIRSQEGIIAANNQARESAIQYNKGLEQMTLGAKAGELALKGLSLAGNMLASWAITAVIQFVVTAFDNFIHRVEKAKEAMTNSKNKDVYKRQMAYTW